MKKFILTIVAALSLTAATAQEEKNEQREPRQITPEAMTDRMAKQLELTDDQKAKVLELNKAYADMFKGPGMRPQRPMGERRARPGGDNQERQRPQMTEEQREAMKKMFEKREEYNTKLKDILTEAQMEKYKSMHQRHGRGPGRGPRGNRGNRDAQ